MLQHMTSVKSPTSISLKEGKILKLLTSMYLHSGFILFNHILNFFFFSGDHVALMVNNLGGSSVLEMNIVAKEAISWLGESHAKLAP